MVRAIVSLVMKLARNVASMGKLRTAYNISIGTRPLGRPRRGWENDIIARTATIRDGVWIDNWIYWTQLHNS
jgi:hypothetical protein